MPHIVTAPLVLAKDSNGKIGYHYQGATLPDGLPKEEVKRLTDEGLVKYERASGKAASKDDGADADAKAKADADAKAKADADAKAKADADAKAKADADAKSGS